MIDPQTLVGIKDLALVARMVLAGFTAGLHPSLRRGAGLEFSQYRTYEPGDDLRRLDWKMFSRSDRYFIREAETETSLRVQFMLDASNSLNYAENNISKIAYAKIILAVLGYLATLQGDEISLHVLQQDQLSATRPQANNGNLNRFWQALSGITPAGKFATPNISQLLLRHTKQKTITIFVSDMYEQETEITDLLYKLRSRNQEVILLHLMGQQEQSLSYEGIFTFEDLETGEQVQVDASQHRQAYQKAYENWRQNLTQNLVKKGISYEPLFLHKPVNAAMRAFLKTRQKYL